MAAKNGNIVISGTTTARMEIQTANLGPAIAEFETYCLYCGETYDWLIDWSVSNERKRTEGKRQGRRKEMDVWTLSSQKSCVGYWTLDWAVGWALSIARSKTKNWNNDNKWRMAMRMRSVGATAIVRHILSMITVTWLGPATLLSAKVNRRNNNNNNNMNDGHL